MNRQLDYWREVVAHGQVRCIYSNSLLAAGNFALDHFIPWSFVCHDQLWNLIPVLPKANSAKGNRLPASRYVDTFIELQAAGLLVTKATLAASRWNKLTEPFVTDLRLAGDDLLTRSSLDVAYRSTISAMATLARQSGYSDQWEYQSDLANKMRIA